MSKKFLALLGFFFLALSPSYVDWINDKEHRAGIVFYYVVTFVLLWFGLLAGLPE
jgi:hypothetical protein